MYQCILCVALYVSIAEHPFGANIIYNTPFYSEVKLLITIPFIVG